MLGTTVGGGTGTVDAPLVPPRAKLVLVGSWGGCVAVEVDDDAAEQPSALTDDGCTAATALAAAAAAAAAAARGVSAGSVTWKLDSSGEEAGRGFEATLLWALLLIRR